MLQEKIYKMKSETKVIKFLECALQNRKTRRRLKRLLGKVLRRSLKKELRKMVEVV
jgi:hypothetical protein